MTDEPDDNEGPQFQGFIPFSQLPPEQQEHLQHVMSQMSAQHAEAVAQQHMYHEDIMHRAYAFFDTLNEDQLRMQMALIASLDEKTAFWIGYMTRLAQDKFGICPADGKKHDEELAAMSSQDGKAWVDFVNELPDDTAKKMAVYNMGFVPGEWPKVKCNRCQNEYVSLEDRMVAGPDDCHFCQEKSAWG